MVYEHLLFRRQFLITPDRCRALDHWQHKNLGKFNIYAHCDIELSIVDANHEKPSMALIGYMIDPNFPDRTNTDILANIQNSVDSIDGICEYLYNISGRFVLVVNYPKDTFVFHDACGLRSVFYTKKDRKIYLGSQPLIFKYVIPLWQGERFSTYNESDYKKSHIEHWLPSGRSLFEEVSHLVPNHYLRLSTLDQVRYWPNQRLEYEPLDKVSWKASELLQGLLKAGNKRFSLAFSLTAGLDSRTLLSACRAIAPDIYFYTLQYRELTVQSYDIAIPKRLLHSLGYNHHVIDCRKKIDPDFDHVYKLNTPMAHNNDWGKIAYGMILGGYPLERVAVKGNCSETCRCFYYKAGNHQPIEAPDQIIDVAEGAWRRIPFVCEQVASWYDKTKRVSEASGIDILDLFYWEHRMGSWQAQSQLEWDIVQEAYTPFNHRGLLETMLSTPPKYRCAPDYSLYKEICKLLWPRVLEEPINPPAPEFVKERLKRQIYRVGLGVARSIYMCFTKKSS